LFGLLSDDSEYMQGVFRSSTSDSSGVADESGLFVIKRDAGAADGTRSVCVLFRQRGGQFDKKCAQDPGNKLRLYSKCCWQFLKILGTPEETQLVELSTVTAAHTYNLPSSPEWYGVAEGNGTARSHYVDQVKILYSGDPILTIY
jgi:hypothetical protein